MSNIKLIVVDLDGTALVPDQVPYARFTKEFASFLDNFVANGGQWGINSTWDVQGELDLVKCSPMTSKPAFLMGELGHQLAKIKDDKIEMVEPYTSTVQAEVRQWGEKYWHQLINIITQKCTLQSMHLYGHFFGCTVGKGQVNALKEVIAQCADLCDSVVIDSTLDEESPRFSMYPSCISKGRVLSEVIKTMGLSPEEVIAAGDQAPDLAMMDNAISAHPICPENAAQEVKDYVLSHGGAVGKGVAPVGIMDAFNQIVAKK